MKSFLLFLLALGSCGLGIGLHFVITAGSTQALRDQVTTSQAQAAAAQEALKQKQAKLDTVPAQLSQAVAAEKARLEAAFQKEKSRLDADIAATNAKNQQNQDRMEAASKDLTTRLAKATSTIEALNQMTEAQRDAIMKDNQYIATLGANLRAAYAATPNAQGQANLDKLSADRAQEANALNAATPPRPIR